MENIRKLERLHEQCAHILQRIRSRVDQIEEIEWQSTTGFLRRELAAQRIRMAKRMGVLLEDAYQQRMQTLCGHE